MEIIEILFVFGILLLIFGPSKLPTMAQEIGKAVYELRKASAGNFGRAQSSTGGKEYMEKVGLLNIAKTLDIDTEGKTITQITTEITDKLSSERGERNVLASGSS